MYLHGAGPELKRQLPGLPILAPQDESQDCQTRRILCSALYALYRDPVLTNATKPDEPVTWGEFARLTGVSDEHIQPFASGIRRSLALRPDDSLGPVNRVIAHCDGNGVMPEVFFRVHANDIPAGDEAQARWIPRIVRPDNLRGRLLGYEPTGDDWLSPLPCSRDLALRSISLELQGRLARGAIRRMGMGINNRSDAYLLYPAHGAIRMSLSSL